MKSILSLLAALALSGPARAAVSIVIEPSSSGGTVFTITQTAENPVLPLSGVTGYALGMALPPSIFNIPGSGTISGGFPTSLGTVTEILTNQSFQLRGLQIGPGESHAILEFLPIYLTSSQTTAQFTVTQPAPVETSISPEALVAGVHTVSDALFGTVTVTVVPEAATSAFLPLVAFGLFKRRRPR